MPTPSDASHDDLHVSERSDEWRLATLNLLHGGGARVDVLSARLLGYNADVLVLTEFRANNAGDRLVQNLRLQGYVTSHCDEWAPNAVLIASRSPIARSWAFNNALEGRQTWCVDTGGVVVCGVGMPNKYAKLPYWERLIDEARPLGVNVIIGDFNTGNNDLDKDPSGDQFVGANMPGRLLESGFIDLWRVTHPDVREYSWFSNANNGFRIDHVYADHQLAARMIACDFDHGPRTTRETDHSALVVTFAGSVSKRRISPPSPLDGAT